MRTEDWQVAPALETIDLKHDRIARFALDVDLRPAAARLLCALCALCGRNLPGQPFDRGWPGRFFRMTRSTSDDSFGESSGMLQQQEATQHSSLPPNRVT